METSSQRLNNQCMDRWCKGEGDMLECGLKKTFETRPVLFEHF